MRKYIGVTLLSLLLISFLAACGGTGETTGSSTTPTTATTPTVEATASVCPTTNTSDKVSAYTIIPAQSEASYEVQEQFLSQDLPVTAKGTTKEMDGNFVIRLDNNPATLSMKMRVDLRTLQSDESRRDGAIRGRWLESDTYPYATFTVTTEQPLPKEYSEGKEVTFNLTGDMTIRKVTRPETFKVTATKKGDTITGKATSTVLMKNYGFNPPSIVNFLTVKDGVTITFNYTSQKSTDCPATPKS